MTPGSLIAVAFLLLIAMVGVGLLSAIVLFAIRVTGHELHISLEPKWDESILDEDDDGDEEGASLPDDYHFLRN